MASSKSAAKRDEIVGFSIVKASSCSECGAELWKGSFLRMEENRPLCMACADLDRLIFLPRGDTALTRRSSKHSTLRAVVVRFSRARRRYERQGILVEEAALERAERECLADEEARALARERAVRAHVRHAHTPYDELLARGRGRLDSRAEVASRVEKVLHAWRGNHPGGPTQRSG